MYIQQSFITFSKQKLTFTADQNFKIYLWKNNNKNHKLFIICLSRIFVTKSKIIYKQQL